MLSLMTPLITTFGMGLTLFNIKRYQVIVKKLQILFLKMNTPQLLQISLMVIISKTLNILLSLILTKLSIKWLWDLHKLQHRNFGDFQYFIQTHNKDQYNQASRENKRQGCNLFGKILKVYVQRLRLEINFINSQVN